MSETKFTPGPWLIEGSGSDIATLRCGLIAVAYDGILSRSIDRDIANANARLISAAPEMYEGGAKLNALIVEAQKFLARYIIPDSGISDTEAVNELLGIFDGPQQREAQAKWDAALAKAVSQ